VDIDVSPGGVGGSSDVTKGSVSGIFSGIGRALARGLGGGPWEILSPRPVSMLVDAQNGNGRKL